MARQPPPVEHQFKKGNKGKPKGTLNIKTRMIKALLKKVEYPDFTKPKVKGQAQPKVTGLMVDFMIASLINQAIKGNIKAFEILFDRTEGPIKNLLELEDEESEPISEIRINIIDPNGYLDKEDEG